jgi:hypothetical protein
VRVALALALALASLLPGCASREAGLEVVVHAEVTRSVTMPQLDVARLTLTSARAVPCLEVMAQHLSPISSAWAHGAGGDPTASPLRAVFDVAVDLATPGRTTLATLRPPPGTWCGLEVTFGPSGSEASWGGTTLLVEATKAGVGRRYVANAVRTLQLPLLARTLSASSRHHELVVQLDPAPLSSLEPAASDARRELLDSLVASVSLSTLE